jgi:hypothetical protein
MTLAPFSAKTRATPRPIPLLEPVIRQILSDKIPVDIILNLFFYPKLTVHRMGKNIQFIGIIRPYPCDRFDA